MTQLLRSAERNHYQRILHENKNDLRKSWRILKQIINEKKDCKQSTEFTHNNTTIRGNTEIAESFNNYFTNIGQTLSRKIPSSRSNPISFLSQRCLNSLYLHPVDSEEVNKVVKQLKDVSAGWDDLKPVVIKKKAAAPILDPLTYIINLSLAEGVVPTEMKIANVTPIYKSGDHSSLTNYRPVSVLPVFSKILERIMYDRVFSFLKSNAILYKY